ncbi:MAG: Oxygen-independent coproporphyrinogen-III oxidase 1 [Firmicutes bacterium ADurb.Bin182]|nr:MAG: Oxygen-independent coproporphyrinogen-III oxidase 1 [Firmicutes bacterium ADurb.Bin182]
MPGLYVHIPFCLRKCRYCDFVSFAPPYETGEYTEALKREIELAARACHLRFDTVFIGGGTPSVLPHGAVSLLLHHINKNFSISSPTEITIECNPGTVDAEKMSEYINSGVNRVSFGLQSSDDALLKRAGRIHDFSDFDRAFDLAQNAGFVNISADIMAGLPGQTQESYLATLEELKKYGLKHISAYSLILEPGTALLDDVMAGREILPDEAEVWAMQDAGKEMLENMGFLRYEISNYSIPGYECRHNVNYWKNKEYLGLGISAHSALRDPSWTRRENARSMKRYLELINAGTLPVVKSTVIGQEEEMFECVMLGLRMVSGIDLSEFEQRFCQSLVCIYKSALDKLYKKGWIQEKDGNLMLTEAGLDMQNAALLEFM